jgi:uncharacterized protein
MSSLSPALSTPTPADLTITPRDRRFGRDAKQRRWWMNGDPVATAFYNALSVTFPKGEAMFIEAVKAHRDGVPPRLAEEIRAFTMQEVMHSREHVAFNRKVEEAGYDLTELNADVDHVIALINARPPMVNLLATIALEHYTAVLAADFLRNPVMLEGADAEWGDMWRWHAIEEIEHKGVAYDTWLHATKDWSRWRRWKAKTIMMLLVTSRFWPKRVKGMKALLAQDGITGWRASARIWWFLLGKPGVLRKLIPAWAAFFKPGFHPWEHDDRHLIGSHDSAYADARMPAAA